MKINNDFCKTGKISFKSVGTFDNVPPHKAEKHSSSIQKKVPEKTLPENSSSVDKFEKNYDTQISRNEIIAFTIAIAAATLTATFAILEMLKKPSSTSL